jgi:hypothetical protein
MRPCFRELKAAPIDGAVFTARDFAPGEPPYRQLEIVTPKRSSLTFSKPTDPEQGFTIEMRLGNPELVQGALTEHVPAGERLIDYVRLASFVDLSGDNEYHFDIGVAIALHLLGEEG